MSTEKKHGVHAHLNLTACAILLIICGVGSLSIYIGHATRSDLAMVLDYPYARVTGSANQAATPTPTPIVPNDDCQLKSPPDPCGLLSDLHWAINNIPGPAPHPRWEDNLKWNLDWSGQSQNKPLLAHAISLWKPTPGPSGGFATEENKIAWWMSFLSYQLGECSSSPCFPAWLPNTTDPKMLPYIKGSELLSNHYDAVSTIAVTAVHFWAWTKNRTDLSVKAKRYLRATWGMYTLAAGSTFSTQRREYWNGDTPSSIVGCQLTANGSPYFDGPFLALAGMRSDPGAGCQDDRGPLFIRAVDWPVSKNLREGTEQKAVCNTLENKWPNQVNAKGVYGLIPDERTTLRNHAAGAYAVDFIISMLGSIRTSANYRFLGWTEAGNQVRATVMETNRNFNTTAVYAVRYKASTQISEYLFPYNINCTPTCTCPTLCDRCNRAGIKAGYAKLLPDPFNPDRFEASNLLPGETSCAHDKRVVTLRGIPATPLQPAYQILLSPNAGAQKVSW